MSLRNLPELALAGGAQDGRDGIQSRGDEGVIGPHAALVAGEYPRLDQNFEVVGDRRLGQAQGGGQIADARLAAVVRSDHGDQLQPDWIGQGFEHPGEVGGLAGGDGLAQQWRAAHLDDGQFGPGARLGGGHVPSMRHILTDAYVMCRVGIDSRLYEGWL